MKDIFKVNTIHSDCLLLTFLQAHVRQPEAIHDSTLTPGYRYWSPSGKEEVSNAYFWPKSLEERVLKSGKINWRAR